MSAIATFDTTPQHNAGASQRDLQSGWLRRVMTKSPTRFVGIDFSIPTVQVATLEANPPSRVEPIRSGDSWCWRNQHQIELPVDPFADVTPELIDHMIDAMCGSLPRCVDGETNVAFLAIPTSWIHYETLHTDTNSQTQEQLQTETQERCDQMFGNSAFRSQAHLSHWPLVKDGTQRMVAATASNTACRIAEGVSGIGYQVQNILPHGVALGFAAPALTSLNPSCVVLLDPVAGLVSITQNGRCGLCRALPPCPRELAYVDDIDSLLPWIDQVVSETLATIKYSARNQVAVDKDAVMMLCGELARMEGMDVAFADRLRRPVATWTYTGDGRPNAETNQHDATRDDAANAVALSLAYAAARSQA